MSTDPKLELYLEALNRALGAVPVSSRAEIVTEIKSHVLSALERDPTQGLDAVLNSLGEPETVANRYLLERGLKPQKPGKSNVVKWLVVGFLGAFGIFVFGILALIWTLTPIVKTDEATGRVQILGGLIDVNEKSGKALVDGIDLNWGDGSSKIVSGRQAVDAKTRGLKIAFANGRVDVVKASVANEIAWECELHGNAQTIELKADKNDLRLDLVAVPGVECDLEVPANLALEIRGTNGKVDLEGGTAAIDVELSNGKVGFRPAAGQAYRYDLNVNLGKVDAFESSSDAKAVPVRMRLTNGVIESN